MKALRPLSGWLEAWFLLVAVIAVDRIRGRLEKEQNNQYGIQDSWHDHENFGCQARQR